MMDYDPQWIELYNLEAPLVARALGSQVKTIHHVGSTSVPGLCAKPIIDILVEVQDIMKVDERNEFMIELGYEPRGELGIPGRRYFSKGKYPMRSHHVHSFQTGNPELDRHLIFRNYLRAHPEDAQEYCRLKRELSAKHPTDVEKYTEEKTPFISEIERKAKEWLHSSEGLILERKGKDLLPSR